MTYAEVKYLPVYDDGSFGCKQVARIKFDGNENGDLKKWARDYFAKKFGAGQDIIKSVKLYNVG